MPASPSLFSAFQHPHHLSRPLPRQSTRGRKPLHLSEPSSSIYSGRLHNIIDGKRGEKADLSPLTRDSRYRYAFGRRDRLPIRWSGEAPFEAWCARPDDVIYGKFLAWDAGRSRKHESDIYDMLVFRYLQADPTLTATFDETYLDAQSQALGPDVVELWESIKLAAQAEARREDGPPAESL